MSKAKRTFVDWLREGERGWESKDGKRQWKLRGKVLYLRTLDSDDGLEWNEWEAEHPSWIRKLDSLDTVVHCIPRPTQRRNVRTHHMYIVVDRDGDCHERDHRFVTKEYADHMRQALEDEYPKLKPWSVVTLTGEFTPKSKGAKR